MEAAATAYILYNILGTELRRSSRCASPRVIMEGEAIPDIAEAALMVCSNGCFLCPHVADVLFKLPGCIGAASCPSYRMTPSDFQMKISLVSWFYKRQCKGWIFVCMPRSSGWLDERTLFSFANCTPKTQEDCALRFLFQPASLERELCSLGDVQGDCHCLFATCLCAFYMGHASENNQASGRGT